jgi:hypothetical protein
VGAGCFSMGDSDAFPAIFVSDREPSFYHKAERLRVEIDHPLQVTNNNGNMPKFFDLKQGSPVFEWA